MNVVESKVMELISIFGEAKSLGYEALNDFLSGTSAEANKKLENQRILIESGNTKYLELFRSCATNVENGLQMLIMHALDLMLSTHTEVELISLLGNKVAHLEARIKSLESKNE